MRLRNMALFIEESIALAISVTAPAPEHVAWTSYARYVHGMFEFGSKVDEVLRSGLWRSSGCCARLELKSSA